MCSQALPVEKQIVHFRVVVVLAAAGLVAASLPPLEQPSIFYIVLRKDLRTNEN